MVSSHPGTHSTEDPRGAIQSERVIPLPRESLFSAFAHPEILAQWWGPHGSVNTFETFEFRPDGWWTFVMRAADGTEYPMRNQFLEIVAPERIVVEHVQAGHDFQLHIAFDQVTPSATRVRWSMVFASSAEAVRVRPFVLAANEQNFDRLEAALGLQTRQEMARAPAI